jgi:cytochrome c peroxidase
MRQKSKFGILGMLFGAIAFSGGGLASETSYMPVDQTADFASIMTTLKKEAPRYRVRHLNYLKLRYDLSDKPSDAAMSKGKPVQEGVRVKLSKGVTWERLSSMDPEEIKQKSLYPEGFLPLPHVKHEAGGQVFSHLQIEEIKKQEGRSLERFDVEFDLPDHFLPEFPSPIYLTTHPELGDVSKGQLVTRMNYFEIFNGLLNPKQLEGLRLLLTPFPQQEFNETADRKTEKASLGVSCFDCHANGHTNAAFHLVGDIRPQELRHRIDTPTLRGVNIQRLFGSQRALKTVEDFTEFEQRGAYFDGDVVIAVKKGINILDRGHQVHAMAEFQEILNFPPAPKLDIFGHLDPDKASKAELRGERLFFGKARCGTCHPAPYYTDNLMHDLKTERFFQPKTADGLRMVGDGPIKTFPLRGIKDSPPYLHDGRLLTLEDTVEFFNLISGTKLSKEEKLDLVAFIRVL